MTETFLRRSVQVFSDDYPKCLTCGYPMLRERRLDSSTPLTSEWWEYVCRECGIRLEIQIVFDWRTTIKMPENLSTNLKELARCLQELTMAWERLTPEQREEIPILLRDGCEHVVNEQKKEARFRKEAML